ncbi:unnamed protein product, partial [Brugia timori]|uniref:NAD-specific glutamate dehydrogenase n=1 Tax=Brugia timori TaxID=42155 RepID=A0A0R3QAU6_9BILA
MASIELDHVVIRGRIADALLHELQRLVVLKAEETRRTHQVALAEAVPGHLRRVVFVAEHRPLHHHAVGTVRDDLTHAHRVHLALHDQIRPHGHHVGGPGRVELAHIVQEPLVAQPKVVGKRTHLRLVVGGDGGIDLVGLGRCHVAVASMFLVCEHDRLDTRHEKAEHHEERVQQRRVIGILEVLVVHLPVARKLVAAVTQDPELLAREGNVELLDNLLGHVLLQRRGLVGVGGEHHAVARRHAQLASPVLRVLEVRWHAADLVDSALERNALQIALEVVGPLVVGADELLGVPVAGAAEFGAAVGAAVLEDGDRVVFRAND